MLAFCVFVGLWAPAPVPPSAPPATYAEAVAPLETGDFAHAVLHLRAFAEAHPDDPDAPDALWDAASVSLDRLADPRGALSALDLLVARYPDSRPAARARARRDTLNAQGARNRPDTLSEFLRLNGTDDAVALQAFIDAHPDAPEAAVARLRLASLTRPGPDPAADPLIDDPELGWRAGRALAEQAYRAGDYAGSLAAAEKVADESGAGRARRMLFAERAADLAAIWVGLVTLFGIARTTRAGGWLPIGTPPGSVGAPSALLSVPGAVRYFFPVALVFLAAAYPMAEAFRPAMLTVALGGTALLWVLAIQPRHPRVPRGLRALGHGATMAAFVYAAIFHFGVLPALIETLRNGVQR